MGHVWSPSTSAYAYASHCAQRGLGSTPKPKKDGTEQQVQEEGCVARRIDVDLPDTHTHTHMREGPTHNPTSPCRLGCTQVALLRASVRARHLGAPSNNAQLVSQGHAKVERPMRSVRDRAFARICWTTRHCKGDVLVRALHVRSSSNPASGKCLRAL